MKVAVVGAGAAGLAALRHLTRQPSLFTVVSYEMTSGVGGTWVYNENTGTDKYGLPIQSSMYTNLRTNLPIETMAFPDFPFPKETSSFIHHEQVLQYLKDYAEHYNLTQHIKFNTLVENISPLKSELGTRWQVKTRYLLQEDSTCQVEEVDAVIVANGHYSVPLVPDIPGLESFHGQVVHSHDYRHPEDFKNKTVLCLGAGSSGQDISLELAKHAKKVYLAHRKAPLPTPLPSNMQQTLGIEKVFKKEVVLSDDSRLEIDVILFCTGYRYYFPFLSPECNLSTAGERVYPLYKHVIHAENPTLAILGVSKVICPFPQFHCQVLFTIAAWTGTMVLPSEDEMKKDIDEDYKERLASGMPHRYAHHMGERQWGYNDMLATLAGFPLIPRVVQSLYDYVHDQRTNDLPNYKRMNFELKNSEEFIVL